MARDMAAKKDRGAKTETLSLRLDPKTKFILEFVGRVNGQSMTTIVERAIRASCGEVQIREGNSDLNWESFWDPDDGVRTLKLLACTNFPSTYDEDDLKRFTEMHRVFFYVYDGDFDAPSLNRAYLAVLWPKIDEYRRIWLEQRERDYWAAGNVMAADLLSAKMKPPAWPPPPRDPPPKSKRGEMEDEIPF
jgi:hypothetical protein